MEELEERMSSLVDKYESIKDNSSYSFMDKLDLLDEIHNVKMKLNGVKPMDTHIDCVGCGS
ncbi:MAG: hypothetical protein Unbinned1473contig1000_63 [Prokaryotic dsDNA virus sp.]|nr:MAG: hypothetical protein Unbinned1473contig1000_63 [Prokaryotic dsDNA virus sp.]|tara:strand:- start:3061 stop:3243 length:183 start_codon:yes stop_codon:yes gene_type:complete